MILKGVPGISLIVQWLRHYAPNAGGLGLIPGLGRFPGERNSNPLQYSCLENPMDGGAWGRLLSMGLQRVGHDWVTSLSFFLLSRHFVENELCEPVISFFFFFFLPIKKFYWGIVDLQCVSFKYTVNWISYTYTLGSSSLIDYYRALNFLCYTGLY